MANIAIGTAASQSCVREGNVEGISEDMNDVKCRSPQVTSAFLKQQLK